MSANTHNMGWAVSSRYGLRSIRPWRDLGWKITRYDSKYGINNYPQITRRILENSSTAVFCRNLHVKHIVGRGFEDETLNRVRLNFRNQTSKQLLRQLAVDLSTHGYYALHINYNLNFEPVSVTRVVPEYLRKGTLDSFGRNAKVAIHQDWTQERVDLPERTNIAHVQYYDTFNDEPEVVRAQIEQAGGIQNYKGQIYVDWGIDDVYPLTIYDAVLPQMLAERGIIQHNQRRVDSNFTATQVFAFTEKFQSDQERTAATNNLRQRKQGDIIVLDGVPEGAMKHIQLNHATNEQLFSHTEESARRAIIRAYGQPFPLHSETRANSLTSTGQEMQVAYLQYNMHTAYDRDRLEESFRHVFSKFFKPSLRGREWNIQTLDFEIPNQVTNVNAIEPNSTE